jgi:iron complex transport system permease protein
VTVTLESPMTSATTRATGNDVVRRARRAPIRHRRLLLAGLSLAVAAAFAARVLLGDYTVTIPDFFRILGGEQLPGATFIVMESKLPRAVLAVLVGLAFGIGGAIFQTTLRNPLASPDIVGVSLGASAAAVTVITLAGGTGWSVAAAAILGALAVALTVRLVAGDHSGFRLVLAGIGLAAAMQSVIQYVFTRVDEYDVQLVLRWL